MPPRRRVSAPPDKVYKSSTPLQQVKFPERTTSIRSYDKKRTIRVPKQETLTQMDFVLMNQWKDEDEEFATNDDESTKEEKKRSSKRRKMVGDEPSRTPQYHTQTITQLDWSFNLAMDEEGNESAVDTQEQLKDRISQSPQRVSKDLGKENVSPSKALLGNMAPPQTPRRALPREIPSSQSPATPQSLKSPSCQSKRSPSKEPLVNVPIPFNINSTCQPNPCKRAELVIEDTFETTEDSQQTHIPSSNPVKSSPAKSVRFAIPGDVELEDDAESKSGDTSIVQSLSPTEPTQSNNLFDRDEIMDSDAESDGEGEEASTKKIEELKSSIPVQNIDEVLGSETCYGEIGGETQLQVEHMLSASSRLLSPTEVEELQADTLEDVNVNSHGAPTQEGEITQGQFTLDLKSQAMESQRLSTQHVNIMAPRTVNSDIFISIYPQHVTNIVNRTKDHEFRRWLISPTVSRMWIYETKPVGMLKYMAVISSAKQPGEIVDERGIGNADFNKNLTMSGYAYEILELYELADPLSLKEMMANAWINGPVQKFAWVRPAVLDQLMANLKPPLFTQSCEDGRTPPSSSTDTQEADEQLISTIRQFTQLAPSSQIETIPAAEAEPEGALIDEVIPSSQHEATLEHTTSPDIVKLPIPSQATTVDLSQSETPRKLSSAEVVWESPTRPIYSSQSLKLPTLRPPESQFRDLQFPYSLASSQLLTKSQMFPESLLNDSIPEPPPFTDEEDDDD